jgi:hypothetical protein
MASLMYLWRMYTIEEAPNGEMKCYYVSSEGKREVKEFEYNKLTNELTIGKFEKD